MKECHKTTNRRVERKLGGADSKLDFIQGRGQSYADKGGHRKRHEAHRGRIKRV